MRQTQTHSEWITHTTPNIIVHTSATVVITSLWEWFYWVSNGIAHMGMTTLTTYTTHFRKHMYWNNWNISTVLTQVKATCITSVQRIVLQTNTIHVWKRVGLLSCFQIKWKFQDTSVHHTSLTLIAKRWSHCSLLKEKTTHSQGYVGGTKVISPLHV